LTDLEDVIFAKQRLIATNNCSGRYSEIMIGRYHRIVSSRTTLK